VQIGDTPRRGRPNGILGLTHKLSADLGSVAVGGMEIFDILASFSKESQGQRLDRGRLSRLAP